MCCACLNEYRPFCRNEVLFRHLFSLSLGRGRLKFVLKVEGCVLLLATETLFHLSCRSFLQLGAGLSVGLSGLAAGFAIGIVGDAGVRGTAQQPRLFVGMILILIFAEVLGLYGLIVALILSTK